MQQNFAVFFALVFSLTVLPAAAQMSPSRVRRAEQIERAAVEKKQAEGDAARGSEFPARMNVDVQMVLATHDLKTFDEAKPVAVSRLTDGDPSWLYVKFNGTLDRYVYRAPGDGDHYFLFVEIGPQGETTAKNHYTIDLAKEDLKVTELKLSLSPGAAGHLAAMPIFLRNAVRLGPGVWNNEIRLTNNPSLPRGSTGYLAKMAITYDFSRGLTGYAVSAGQYDSMVLRGTTDKGKLPLAGKFSDDALLNEIRVRVAAEGITPESIYFAGDGWSEYSDSPASVREFRNVFAAFPYTRGKDCFYGVAEIVQKYDTGTSAYGNSSIKLQTNISVPCTSPK